ncbi:hypothetical protein [Lacticaseibacillus mingshuiensis]|uniref:Helix-turn-helix domain-containing protein n=2 Tax=Lacticaseibacillus mingshuiensis TaxID=2799574 RepID=A0ABW4CKH6_9LACO|nr:hypothetical protein [Lacticaseibacillus mingshuiensis]
MTVTLKYLVEHGVTRAELARQIGLAPTTVTRVLRQQRTTTVTKRKVKSYLRQLKKGTRQMPPGLE